MDIKQAQAPPESLGKPLEKPENTEMIEVLQINIDRGGKVQDLLWETATKLIIPT